MPFALPAALANALGPSAANVESQDLRDCEAFLAEAKAFSKALKQFDKATIIFEKGSDKLVSASQGVVDSSGQLAGEMNAARGSLVSEMAASVHAPVADWQQQFRLVAAQHKQLVKLASSYGKSEGSLEKATVKRTKATAAGAKDEKQAKLQHSLEDKAQRHEMAKTAFVCTAPQVSADFKSLLRKRDELRVNLFAAFTVSARALSTVASLSPGGGGGGGKGGSDHPGRRSSKDRRSQTAVQPFSQPLV